MSLVGLFPSLFLISNRYDVITSDLREMNFNPISNEANFKELTELLGGGGEVTLMFPFYSFNSMLCERRVSLEGLCSVAPPRVASSNKWKKLPSIRVALVTDMLMMYDEDYNLQGWSFGYTIIELKSPLRSEAKLRSFSRPTWLSLSNHCGGSGLLMTY